MWEWYVRPVYERQQKRDGVPITPQTPEEAQAALALLKALLPGKDG